MVRIARMALRHRSEPMPFHLAVSGLVLRYLSSRGVQVDGSRWLDVGTGNGVLPMRLLEAGAREAVGLDVADRRVEGAGATRFVAGRAERLPFPDATFDGVTSSNVLEHTRDTEASIGELLRVTRPGGVIFLSWTNWYSPMGGHEWSPFHYLGPDRGVRTYEAVRGKPPPWNLPGRTLFPVHVGDVVRRVRALDVDILDVAPRYWPSWRFLADVPGLREVALWNCVILMRARGDAQAGGGEPSTGVSGGAFSEGGASCGDGHD
jgi:SAM-dependent methyltransferase